MSPADETTQAAHEFREMLMEMNARAIQPALEFGQGIRLQCLQLGWGEMAADQISSTAVSGLMMKLFTTDGEETS